MARNYEDWLTAYMNFCTGGESPPKFNFWVGASVLSGALRRHVWLDMLRFKWYPNQYVILVAPPGVISKTTTTNIGMNLLRKVPGMYFGATVTTWESLVQAFAATAETFEYGGEVITQSPLTIESGEFGNLFDPKNREMVDLFVTLWDSKDGNFEKRTKMAGNDTIINPFINLIACTTPSWISENFPKYLIGGGFASRCLFVYGDTKDAYIAYPDEHVIPDHERTKLKLIQDLEHISSRIIGPYKLSSDARAWGREWYEDHHKNHSEEFDKSLYGGYIARKQSHTHKLSMLLAASCSDERIITLDNLVTATQMVTDLEPDMHLVFDNIGRTETSNNASKVVEIVCSFPSGIRYLDLYRRVYVHFPSSRVFEDVLTGLVRSGFLIMRQEGPEMILRPGPNTKAA
jgi:hypothetical protein